MSARTVIGFARTIRAVRALALSVSLLGGALPAWAQSPQSLEAAVMQLSQASAAPALGPAVFAQRMAPSVGASCEWCSSSFLGICFSHDGESWSQALDIRWQVQLDDALAQSAAIDRKLGEHTGAAQAWMANLPAFSTRFDSVADVVLGVQAEIASGAPTDAQRARATQGLQELLATVSASADQLEKAAQVLATALQEQSAYRTGIGSTLAASQQAGQQALADLENAARTHRCQGGVPQQLDAIRAGVNAAQDQARVRVAELSARSTRTEQSVATLLGAVISARSQLENVLRLVRAAGNDQFGGFLAQLHLGAAKQQWRELAAMQARAAGSMAAQARLAP